MILLNYQSDPLLFWTAFGAIGGTLGAIATFIAVIVALWQTKFSESKKLKLSFSNSMVLFDPLSILPKQQFIQLSVTNTGNRNIIISKWGFMFHKKDMHAILGINQSITVQQLNQELPYMLEKENSLQLYWERDHFIASLKDGVDRHLLQKNRKLTFFICDSTGKIYIIKTKSTVANMIAEQ